ncbi:efflux RND transporter periplasmic adaptor subunit [Aliidongia dinghuensis]|uniref:efflux RND transporter periplasmic adaptor subunit n=1 Tax=Aliidongia dinghuensis TaxID=1867774 RepID=UPI001662DEC6|nr:efflux RND transporter periplasmic adaptor subunit [Aliidongia dinghuensis]
MTEVPVKLPSARRLLAFGAAALVVAGAILARGLIERARTRSALDTWTNDQAVQTVALAKIEQNAAFRTLSLPGTIQPYNRAAIYARVSGYLKSWNEDIGAHVTTGQQLASIDTPDLDQQLDQAKADLASAEANAALADLTAKRWRALVASQAVAQQAVDEKAGDAAAKKAVAEAARANVRRLEALEAFKNVVAPFDGVVTARKTDIGALINAGSGAGQELFEIADLHKVRIYVQVPQAFTAELHPGLKAKFVLPENPGQPYDATLVTTSNAVDSGSRSMLVELQADNPDGRLAAGTYCEVQFQVPGDPHVVRLPATALVPVDKGVEVAVVGPDDKVAMTPIKLGRDFGDTVEVTAGLKPTDRVIDSPAETLQAGDAVRVQAPAADQVAGAAPAKAD